MMGIKLLLITSVIMFVTNDAISAPAIGALRLNRNAGVFSVYTIEPAEVLQVAIAATWNGGAAPADEVLRLVNATISSANWAPWVALNPFTGAETSGLYFREDASGIFASFQTTNAAADVHELLDLETAGSYGRISFSGMVIEDGLEFRGLYTFINGVVWEQSTMDFDNDGDIDIIDFGLFADAFGSTTGQSSYNRDADSEPDGDVDIIDFGAFADVFGDGSAVSVPEPTTSFLLSLSLLGFLKRKPQTPAW